MRFRFHLKRESAMKRILFPAFALMLTALANAQTPPNNTDPPTSSPSAALQSSMQNPSTTGTGNYSNESGDDKWQMKDCIAQQKKTNPNLTAAQMKANCQKQ